MSDVPPIPQQIQISVDQPYAGPAASCCGIIGTHSNWGKWADWAGTTLVKMSQSDICDERSTIFTATSSG
jgi:hypothetical protein